VPCSCSLVRALFLKLGPNDSPKLFPIASSDSSSDYWTVFYFFASQSLHNRIFLKQKSGEAKDSAIFAFYFLLHKRAKPILPPYLLPHLRARTQTLYSPLTFSLTSARELKPFTPPVPSPSTHLSAHTSNHAPRAFRATYERQSVLNQTQKKPPSKSLRCTLR